MAVSKTNKTLLLCLRNFNAGGDTPVSKRRVVCWSKPIESLWFLIGAFETGNLKKVRGRQKFVLQKVQLQVEVKNDSVENDDERYYC